MVANTSSVPKCQKVGAGLSLNTSFPFGILNNLKVNVSLIFSNI